MTPLHYLYLHSRESALCGLVNSCISRSKHGVGCIVGAQELFIYVFTFIFNQ